MVIPTRQIAGLGALVATPGYIREQIRALDAEYEIFGRQLRAQIDPCLPDKPDKNSAACVARRSFASQIWTPLKTSWEDFAASHEAWYNRLWGATVDLVDEYRQRLRDARAQSQRTGFVLVSPDPVGRSSDPLGALGKVLKIAIVGAAIIGTGVVLYKVLPAGRRK